MVQIESNSREFSISLTKREQLVIIEIGLDRIDSASRFVEYMSDSYGISKSSVWYLLNRLKDKGVLGFASKDDPGKDLELTRNGRDLYRQTESQSKKILEYFTRIVMRETALSAVSGRFQFG